MLQRISSLTLLLCLALTFSSTCPAQPTASEYEFEFKVDRVYPAVAITKDQLAEAKSIVDINMYFKPSWIKEYLSMDMYTKHEGKQRKAISKNDILSKEQKANLQSIDEGSEVYVEIHYIPENNLKQNPPKKIDFVFTIDPEQDAAFAAGEKELLNYLKKTAIDKIPANTIKQYGMTAVKFTVDQTGHIYDVNLFWSSDDENVDNLLIETICNMPNWIPAQYANGTKVEQEFVLSVGDPSSCVANMLNTSRDQSHLPPMD